MFRDTLVPGVSPLPPPTLFFGPATSPILVRDFCDRVYARVDNAGDVRPMIENHRAGKGITSTFVRVKRESKKKKQEIRRDISPFDAILGFRSA